MGRRVLLALLVVGCAGSADRAEEGLPRASVDGTEHYALTARHIEQTFSIDVWQPIRMPGPHPVVYVTDGNILFATVAQMVGPMMYARVIPPMIVVGIGYEDVTGFEVASLRTRDFLPTYVAGFEERMAAQGFAMPEGVRPGGADAFLSFLEHEVKPFIAARYDVDTDDETLIGDSYGGTFATHVLLNATDSFDRYVIGSPALAWDDEKLFNDEAARAASGEPMRAEVFMSAGGLEIENGILAGTKRMVETLESRSYEGLKLRSHVFEDETHESVLGVTISRGLRAVFGTWPDAGLP
jgi:hypothetical protein